MTKKQIAVIKESIKISPRVAYRQYKEFAKQDMERKARSRRDARLIALFK